MILIGSAWPCAHPRANHCGQAWVTWFPLCHASPVSERWNSAGKPVDIHHVLVSTGSLGMEGDIYAYRLSTIVRHGGNLNVHGQMNGIKKMWYMRWNTIQPWKEGNSVLCEHTDEPGRHGTKWNKLDTGQILCHTTYMESKIVKHRELETRMGIAR